MTEYNPGGFPNAGRSCGCPSTMAQDLRRVIRDASEQITTIIFHGIADAPPDDPHLDDCFENPYHQYDGSSSPGPDSGFLPDQAPAPNEPFAFAFQNNAPEPNLNFHVPEPKPHFHAPQSKYPTPRPSRNHMHTNHSSTKAESPKPGPMPENLPPSRPGPSVVKAGTSAERPHRNQYPPRNIAEMIPIYSPVIHPQIPRHDKGKGKQVITENEIPSSATATSNYHTANSHTSSSSSANITIMEYPSQHPTPISSSDNRYQCASCFKQEPAWVPSGSGTSHTPTAVNNPDVLGTGESSGNATGTRNTGMAYSSNSSNGSTTPGHESDDDDDDDTLEALCASVREYITLMEQEIERTHPRTKFYNQLILCLRGLLCSLPEQRSDAKFQVSGFKLGCCTLGLQSLTEYLNKLKKMSLQIRKRSTSTSNYHIDEYTKLHSEMVKTLTDWHVLFQTVFRGV